jgi:hypothetical protein
MLAATGLVQVVAAPAHAANGIVVVNSISPSNSVSAKVEFVPCPAGTKVLGGGGQLVNGANRVHFSTLKPDGDANGFWAGAAEIRPGDYASTWRIRAYAICGPALAGLQYLTTESVVNSNATRQQQAVCPVGKRMISAGAEIYDEFEYVVLDDVEVLSDLRTANVWAIEREVGTTYSWSLVAHAVCANSSAVAGYQRVEVSSTSTTGAKSITLTCPAGKTLYSTGFAQAGSGGHTLLQGLVPDAGPAAFHASITTDPTGAPSWSIKAQGICGS